MVSFASWSLKPSEKNYPAHKLEFLALKWSITEKFHDHLYGADFEVLTDNNPLTYVFTTAKLDATGHRWLAELSNYNFSIKYCSNKKNADADALSRLQKSETVTTVFPEVIKPICKTVIAERDSTSLFEGIVTESKNTEMSIEEDIPEEVLSSTAVTSHDWHNA